MHAVTLLLPSSSFNAANMQRAAGAYQNEDALLSSGLTSVVKAAKMALISDKGVQLKVLSLDFSKAFDRTILDHWNG